MSGDEVPRLERRPRVAAAGVILHRGRVLLVRRGTPPHSGLWTYPGGKVEWGETVREACRREVREETGLEVEPTEVLEVFEARIPGGDPGNLAFHYVIIDLLCRIPDRARPEPVAASDAEEVRWFAPDELDTEEVTDGVLPILEKALRVGG